MTVFRVALLALVCLPPATARAQDGPLKGLDDRVTQALKDWEVPGLALAVVQDDKVILAKGYGVRKLGRSDAVDARTVFAIGSVTKAFTATALGMLVDEGKLKWDDPAIKHLPRFQLFDPYVTREITVRDLLTHRSGLGRYEFVWYAASSSRDEILARLQYARPNWGFRSKFGYQNMMYLAAGQIVPAVKKQSWDDFVKARLTGPLGMTATTTSIKGLDAAGNVATPHGTVEDRVEPIAWRDIDNIGPAGSIASNATDMAQWLRLHLGRGRIDDRQLVTSGTIAEMQKPQTIISLEGAMAKRYPEAHFLTYGLGWFLHDYRGRKVVDHGGNIDGMTALAVMVPEEKLGFVMLTNREDTLLPIALKYHLLDAYLKAPARDWGAEMLKDRKALEKRAKEAKQKEEKERVAGTKPSLALEKYAGTYKDDLFGEVKVSREGEKLALRYGPAFAGDLEHWHYDTFRITWKDRTLGKTFVVFRLDQRGKVEELKLAGLGGDGIVVRKAVDAPAKPAVALGEAELKKFVGRYELKAAAVELSVELVGGKLKATVAGQSPLTMVPVSPVRFRLEGAPAGFFAEFAVKDGAVQSLKLEQAGRPDYTLLPKK